MPELNDVDSLLAQLFEQPAEAWPQRLADLCAQHPTAAAELRRRYDLLRATGLDATPRFDAPAPDHELPERLGEFRLVEQLGSGGMGVVFIAEQTSLGRQVALKVVRPELLFSDAARERFRREVESIARLEHPAIVPVLTHGEERGIPFYAMPLVHGCPCDEVIRKLEGRDPAGLTGRDLQRAVAGDREPGSDSGDTFAGAWWQACVHLLRQVALGLHHAHTRGVLHRDVKPSNILLTPDGRALLLDFGLAHVRDDARITRTGTAPGSLAWMAPEQMRGQACDERADVYSLAATLRHLVSLKCPFPIADPEVLRTRVLAGQVEPLGDRVAPPELLIVLAAAMDIDRELRHPDAQAFADDLQAVLDQRPIRARPLPRGLRLRRWCGRHRTTTALLASAAVVAALFPSALWWQQRRANTVLAAQTERAERNFARSLEVIDRMLVHTGNNKLRNVPAAQRVAADMVEQAVDYFDRMAAEEGPSSALRMRHLDAVQKLLDLRFHLRDLPAAEALARRNLEMIGESEIPPEARPGRALGRVLLATILSVRDQHAAALQVLDEAAGDLRADVPARFQAQAEDTRSRILDLRGMLLDRAGDGDGARAAFVAALAIRRKLLSEPPVADHQRNAAVSAYHAARVLRRQGDAAGALTLVHEAIAWLEGIDEDACSWPTPAMVRTSFYVELGLILDFRKDEGSAAAYTTAIEHGERAVRDYPDLPEPRLSLGAARSNLARLLVDKREFARARDLATAAVADLQYVVRESPTDAQAPTFLFNACRTQCFALRELLDYAALAPAARAYGGLPGRPEGPRGAARYLLRCAEQVTGAEAEGLRQEALDLLLEAERRGWGKASLEDDLYEPLVADPRFAALRVRIRGREEAVSSRPEAAPASRDGR